MSDVIDQPGSPRFEVRITSDSHFGWLRTRMALERTQMAWIRTGVSLIGFGFTIYQVLDWMPNPRHGDSARDLGLILIATGILAMVMAVWDYHVMMVYLWCDDFKPLAGLNDRKRHHSRVLPVTLVVLFAGICAFVAVALRVP
ncbi:MAG TPA: DUF202 domain-containing protein [Candidatus Tumulicola sp.]|jgi:putative membrane protein